MVPGRVPFLHRTFDRLNEVLGQLQVTAIGLDILNKFSGEILEG
jgi:hypothetical protein